MTGVANGLGGVIANGEILPIGGTGAADGTGAAGGADPVVLIDPDSTTWPETPTIEYSIGTSRSSRLKLSSGAGGSGSADLALCAASRFRNGPTRSAARS